MLNNDATYGKSHKYYKLLRKDERNTRFLFVKIGDVFMRLSHFLIFHINLLLISVMLLFSIHDWLTFCQEYIH